MTHSYEIYEEFHVQMDKQKIIFFMPLSFEDIFRNEFCTKKGNTGIQVAKFKERCLGCTFTI